MTKFYTLIVFIYLISLISVMVWTALFNLGCDARMTGLGFVLLFSTLCVS